MSLKDTKEGTSYEDTVLGIAQIQSCKTMPKKNGVKKYHGLTKMLITLRTLTQLRI